VREAKSRLFMHGSKRGRERERGVCVRECEKERAGERESCDFRERKIELEREREGSDVFRQAVTFSANP
jgi:hypothetical protein